MKAASISELKTELNNLPPKDVVALCLRLAKFKKENKELLTYLLFDSGDEEAYIEAVKREMDREFQQVNRRNLYFVKKSLRKILRITNKYIRYSLKKETQIELLIYYCHKLRTFDYPIRRSTALIKLYERQIQKIRKTIPLLHEDLQFDYQEELKAFT